MILNNIVNAKLKRIEENKKAYPLEKLKKDVFKKGEFRPVSFLESLRKNSGAAVIAEVKKASPSKGIISEDFDYLKIAKKYEQAGAAAVSVLTEEDFFMGSDRYLSEIKKHVAIPVLRKDFIIDEYQIYEAKKIGADAILLICGILTEEMLSEFCGLAESIGLDCLVETHDEEEVKMAVNAGAKIIGINNRNLRTFNVDLKITEKLIKNIPAGIIKVSESGIHSAEDAAYLKKLGADAILVGESLMKSGDIDKKLIELLQAERL